MATPTANNVEPLRNRQTLKYCDRHWAYFMFSLMDRGLGDVMRENDPNNPENPAFEGSTLITTTALQFFGAQVIFEQHAGCPACAFDHIIDHVSDQMTVKYKEPQ